MQGNYIENSFFSGIVNISNEFDKFHSVSQSDGVKSKSIEKILAKNNLNPNDLLVLLQIQKEEHMEALLNKARFVREQRFGNRINLYAPLYVSSYCDNKCQYCSFKKSNNNKRIKLSYEQVMNEADYLKNKGITHILIVSGESDIITNVDYFNKLLSSLTKRFNCVTFEVQPFGSAEYKELYMNGLDGVTVYQETYLPDFYSIYHQEGNKSDYRFRLETPERIAVSDIPNVTIGALIGLAPYIQEMYFLAKHLDYLIKKYWRINFSVSFPRMIDEGIDFRVPYNVNEFNFVKVIASMRLIFPDTPIYLSTREKPYIRDNIMNYGITHMSVESKTEPGGYTVYNDAQSQFNVMDTRSVEELIDILKVNRLRPVFKDWDKGYRRNSR